MGIIARLIGNATDMNERSIGQLTEELEDILFVRGEKIESAYTLVRDKIVFTQYRMILIDVQQIGNKKSYKSIPYRSISRFEIETTGLMDLDSELKLFISGQEKPVYILTFKSTKTIHSVGKVLSAALINTEDVEELEG